MKPIALLLAFASPCFAQNQTCDQFMEYKFEDGATNAKKQLDHLDKTDNDANEEKANADKLAAARAKGLGSNQELTNAENAARVGEKMSRTIYCGHCKQIAKNIEALDTEMRASCAASDIAQFQGFLDQLRGTLDEKCAKRKPYDKLCADNLSRRQNATPRELASGSR